MSRTDKALVREFAAFARHPRIKTARRLPWSPAGVRLGLGSELLADLDPSRRHTPTSWRISSPNFRGHTGPFSALRTLRLHVEQTGPEAPQRLSGDLQVTVGPHPHCASPPEPPPRGMEAMRRVSVQPADDSITSCLDWFTVDLFLDTGGDIAAVTLDLWEP